MLVTRDHTTTNLTLLVATESEGKSIILVTGDSTTTNITLLEGLRNSASYWLLGTQLYYNKYHNATESEEQSITMVTLVPSLI